MDGNKLTGIIPSELSTLTRLEQLFVFEKKEESQKLILHRYLDFNRLSGIIPSTLSTLTRLTHL